MRSSYQASWKELELWNEPLNEKANNRGFIPRSKNFFSSSAPLSMKFQLLINVLIVKMGGKCRFKTQKLSIYPAHKC